MAENVLVEHLYGGCLITDIYKHTACSLLSIGENGISKCDRRKIHLRDSHPCAVEAVVKAMVVSLALDDVQEVALKMIAFNAGRLQLELVIHLVLLCYNVKNLKVLIVHGTVGVHEFVNQILSNLLRVGKVLHQHVAHRVNGLTAHADIDLGNLCLHTRLQTIDDIGYTLHCLICIIDHTLADAGGGIFPYHSIDSETAVVILLTGNTCDFC